MRSVLVGCALLIIPTLAVGQDWPPFRGPGGQGHSDERGLPLEWSATRNVLWKAAVPGREALNVEVFRIGNAALLNAKNSHASPTPVADGDHVYFRAKRASRR